MCSCDAGEAPEFYREELRTAHRKHRCEEWGCRRPIKPGEQYALIVGKWEGEFVAHKMCARCIQYVVAFRNVDGCFPPMGASRDEVKACAEERPEFMKEFRAALRAVRRAA